MKLFNRSGPAIFMYSIIAITLVTSITCFYMYYGRQCGSDLCLWIGITAFTIMYHFWVRIIMGNISKLFRKHINYKQRWFKERRFEKKIYKILKVKNWKDKAFTYNPGDFSVKDRSLEEIANTMAKSEIDHWINEAISISTMFFGLIWGKTLIFVITALCAMIFDGQFIVIQRYNRPRIVKLLERKEHIKTQKENKKL